MKDLFVITNISPVFNSKQPDSKLLTPDMKSKYSGVNSKITFKRVINLDRRIIEDDSLFMHFGNTNPPGLRYFSKYVDGIKKVDSGLMLLDSDKIVKGVVLEIEYNKKDVEGTTHIIPIADLKIIDYIKLEKVKKSDDKITRLF
jgi:hypothetical protein